MQVKPPVNPTKPNHYIDNDKFYDEITKYHYAYKAAKERGEEKPRISNYLGECVKKIAKGLATKSNFRNYSYIDDMMSAAIEDCIKHMHSFDPTKSRNPFSYFTQACYFSFIHQIQKEKKQTVTKKRILMNSAIELYELQSHDDEEGFVMPLIQYLSDIDVSSLDIPKKKETKKKLDSLNSLFEDE
jgi:hypothetical protein